jgi:adenylylsulfate kinase
MTGAIVWITGLPASGKSTLARHVREQLASRRACVILDSDEMRTVLGATRYDDASRDDFYRTMRELARLLASQGIVVLVAATAPRREHRSLPRDGSLTCLEVYVRTPVDVCEARDPKGLYAAARATRDSTLPGVGSAFEPPLAPDVVAEGGDDPRAVDTLVALLLR